MWLSLSLCFLLFKRPVRLRRNVAVCWKLELQLSARLGNAILLCDEPPSFEVPFVLLQESIGWFLDKGPEAVQKMQPMFVGQSFNPTMAPSPARTAESVGKWPSVDFFQTKAMYDFPLTNDGYQDLDLLLRGCPCWTRL